MADQLLATLALQSQQTLEALKNVALNGQRAVKVIEILDQQVAVLQTTVQMLQTKTELLSTRIDELQKLIPSADEQKRHNDHHVEIQRRLDILSRS